MKEETKIKRMNEYVESKGIALKILLKYILRDKDLTFERKRQIIYKDYTRILNAMEEYKELSERQTPTEPNNSPETKQLIIGDVSKQRELLIAYGGFIGIKDVNYTPDDIMKEIIVFTFKDADPFLYVPVNHNFNIGDTVYYELTDKDKSNDIIKKYYPHLDCEGVITDKWIDISDMKILWTVEIDCG